MQLESLQPIYEWEGEKMELGFSQKYNEVESKDLDSFVSIF